MINISLLEKILKNVSSNMEALGILILMGVKYLYNSKTKQKKHCYSHFTKISFMKIKRRPPLFHNLEFLFLNLVRRWKKLFIRKITEYTLINFNQFRNERWHQVRYKQNNIYEGLLCHPALRYFLSNEGYEEYGNNEGYEVYGNSY